MSKVYVLECNGLYKVGVAKDVVNRIAQLQTGNGSIIKEVTSYEFYDMAYVIERTLHKDFKHYKTVGEWFALDVQAIEALKLKLKFEWDFLRLVGCEDKQKIYSTLVNKWYTSTTCKHDILAEMANLKYKEGSNEV